MTRKIVEWLFKLIIWVVYSSYKADGLNALFLILPAKFLGQILRRYGAIIGENVEVHTPITFHNVSTLLDLHYANLRIGSDCYLGKEVFLDLAEKITIEDKVTISMRAMLITHTHAGNSPLSDGVLLPFYAPILLKKGCYLGAGVLILPGITIGENAIVGAGAVVTHDIPANTVFAGIPARVIISREDE